MFEGLTEATDGRLIAAAGYDRRSVDAFLDAAAEVRTALEHTIGDARARAARARMALEAPDLILGRFLATHRMIERRRRDAQLRACWRFSRPSDSSDRPRLGALWTPMTPDVARA
jgi:hypothetical protein